MDFKRGNVTIDGVDRERRPRLLCLDEGLNAEPGPVNASLRSLGLFIPEMKYSPILTGGWACGRIDRRVLRLMSNYGVQRTARERRPKIKAVADARMKRSMETKETRCRI